MSGLFNFTKEGQGVSKNPSNKKPFFRFWEMYFQKFSRLCVASALFMLFFTPIFAISLISSYVFYENNTFLFIVFSLLPFVLCGPLISGLTKITRNLSQNQPIFMFSDFKKAVLANFRTSLMVSTLTYILLCVCLTAVSFYFFRCFDSLFYILPLIIALLCTALVIFSQYYAYLLIVTVKLKFKVILKNCFIFSILSFGKNIIITIALAFYVGIASLFFIMALTNPIYFILGGLFLFFLVPGHISFIANYVSYPQIKKYVIEPYYKEHPELTAVGATDSFLKDEQAIVIDMQAATKSEYVYDNGRMIHKSLLDNKALFEDKEKDKNK